MSVTAMLSASMITPRLIRTPSDFGMQQPGHCTAPALPAGDNRHCVLKQGLKAEAVHGVRFETDAELRKTLHRYVWFHNHRRLHSAFRYCSPVDYEARAA